VPWVVVKKTTQKIHPVFFKAHLKKIKPTKKPTFYFFFEKIYSEVKQNRQDTCTVNFNFF